MRSLIVSGGGSKGSWQVGVLRKWMLEDKKDYDILCGTSVGAINAAYLSQTPTNNPVSAYTSLEQLWKRVDNSKVKKNWWLFRELAALWKTSVYDSSPLQKWIESELDEKAIKNSGKQLRMVSVCWDTGLSVITTEKDDNLAKWVEASSSTPIFMIPININGKMYTDGGLRNITPLGEAIKAGADDIDIIMCDNPDLPNTFNTTNKKTLDYASRALDIMVNQITLADLKICGLKNQLVELNPKYKKINMRLIYPKTQLPFDSGDFSAKSIASMMEMGYTQAKEI